VSPVKYELGFYIPEDDILHSHCSENLKSYIDFSNLPNSSGCTRTWIILSLYQKLVPGIGIKLCFC
jgi:hypothetical protein